MSAARGTEFMPAITQAGR